MPSSSRFRAPPKPLPLPRKRATALESGPIRVRMGLHTGEPIVTDEGYVGIDVHRAARIAAAAHGGQIVLSETTRGLLESDTSTRDLGEHRLKDLAGAERLYQLGDGEFPPLRTLDATNLPVAVSPLIGRESELESSSGCSRTARASSRSPGPAAPARPGSVEALYGFVRTAEVMGGDESTVLFEKWLESGDDSLLRDIEAYNEEDCRSTVALHEWLLHSRPPGLPWRPTHEPEPPEEEMPHERAVLRDELLARSAEEGDAPWLLAQLLDYHRREAKPQWWEWFLHLSLDEEELIEDTDTIGGLELVGEPEPDKSSLVYTFSFPEQEHKISGDSVDPATEKAYTVHGRRRAWARSRCGGAKDRADEPLPRALIPGQPIHDKEQREALSRLARAYLEGEASLAATRGARASPSARAARPAAGGRRLHDRGQLPLRAGPARLGQDVAGGEDGGRADARRASASA